jgi:hypothetical protein
MEHDVLKATDLTGVEKQALYLREYLENHITAKDDCGFFQISRYLPA